ncbi:hypothetical protein ACFYOD_18955 [Streptomyces sp. NPDC006703]
MTLSATGVELKPQPAGAMHLCQVFALQIAGPEGVFQMSGVWTPLG